MNPNVTKSTKMTHPISTTWMYGTQHRAHALRQFIVKMTEFLGFIFYPNQPTNTMNPRGLQLIKDLSCYTSHEVSWDVLRERR